MAKEDAKITVGADASDVEKAFAKAKDAAHAAAAEMIGEMAKAAKGVVGSFAEIATAQGKVNFHAQHEQVREFEHATARLATAAGGDLQSMRNEIISTGKEIGMQPQKVAQWASEVGKLTYNFHGATEGIKGISQLSALTGKSVDEYRGFATVLATVGHVSGETTEMIGTLIAQADEIGTVGGPAAFIDQVNEMGNALTQFSIKSQADFLNVTAGMAALTKGLDPAAAKRVQQGALGTLSGDSRRWERYLGKDIVDKDGHVKDPMQVLQEITDKTRKTYGSGQTFRHVMRQNFGDELGSAMANGNLAAAKKIAGIEPSGKAEAAEHTMLGTDAGKREVAGAQLFESSNALMNSSTLLGQAADKLQEFSASNPFLSTMAMNVGGAAGENVLGRFGKAGKGLLEGGSKGGIDITSALGGMNRLGGAAGVASKAIAGLGAAGAVAGAAFAGWQAGKMLDEKFKISDKFGIRGTAEKDFADTRGALDAKVRNMKIAGASVRGAGLKGVDMKAAYDATNAAVEGGNMPGGAGMNKAIYEGLVKSGKSEKDAAMMSKAITDAMGKVKIVVQNGTGGPVEVAVGASESAAAGSQK